MINIFEQEKYQVSVETDCWSVNISENDQGIIIDVWDDFSGEIYWTGCFWNDDVLGGVDVCPDCGNPSNLDGTCPKCEEDLYKELEKIR